VTGLRLDIHGSNVHQRSAVFFCIRLSAKIGLRLRGSGKQGRVQYRLPVAAGQTTELA
jgi:hypothetical protein